MFETIKEGENNGPLIQINIELRKEYEKKSAIKILINLDKRRFC